jgi:hypothetical protein
MALLHKIKIITDMEKKKNYSVDFMVKQWIEVYVKADSEEQAKELARKMVDNNKGLTIIDEVTECAGVRNMDILHI